MWKTIGAAIWGFIQPYITPLLAFFAGETWRAQLEQIKQLEAERDAKQKEADRMAAALHDSLSVIGLSKQAALDELKRRGVQDVSGKSRKK